jgi:hypothetical protein
VSIVLLDRAIIDRLSQIDVRVRLLFYFHHKIEEAAIS